MTTTNNKRSRASLVMGIGAAGLFGALAAAPAQATIIGVGLGSFGAATVEDFNDSPADLAASSFNYSSGLVHLNLDGQTDVHNYHGSYGMGDEPSINSGGKDGPNDGYFGTGVSPTSFQLTFGGGVTQFGFYGAESSVSGGSNQRNGELNIDFYDLANVLIASIAVNTAGVFAWDQFHGFASDAGAIGRVVFNDVGHMVLDDVMWSAANVPEPATLALLGLGLFGARRRIRG